MLGIVIVLAAAGVHMGSMDRAPAVAMLEELPIGEAVRVEDVHGRVVSGTIADVSQALTIAEKESAVVVQRHEVLVVKRQDSIVNGVLVGVAAGVVGGAMVIGRYCGTGECANKVFPMGVGGGWRLAR